MQKPLPISRWLLALLLLAGSITGAWAQASPVTVSPVFFTENTPITLTFDATLGNAGMANYTGDVYIYTGLITNVSSGPSAWRYIVNNSFGSPTAAEKMTPLGNHRYSISFTPRTFYPGFAASGETMLKLAMVFRGPGGSPEGKGVGNSDIFVDVAQNSALQVTFVTPSSTNNNPTVVTAGASVPVVGTASSAANLTLTLNGTQVAQQNNATSLTSNVTVTQPGVNTLVLTATSGATTATATTTLLVPPTVPVAALPAGANADGVTYLNNGTSAVFTLTAPNKSHVYLLGDFNNWQLDNNALLSKTATVDTDPATGRWWVQVNNLTPGTEYAYQFLVDGNLRVADPYCEKVLDPSNDQYIPASTYPNLKAYPTGKTSGIVSVMQPGQTPYVWQVSNFQRPARANLVVYELLVRDFVASHDYQTVIDSLAYLKRLGVNAIELMPVNEFEGNDSWGYNPSFYFAPDKYYGTATALKQLIDACHQRGMAVILDMVLNHSCDQSPMVQLYRDNGGATAANPWYNRTATHPFNVCNDFNHESAYTRYFTKNVIRHWLQNYHIDGYRFDLSKGFTQVNSGSDVNQWGQFDQSRVNIWQDYYNTMVATDATLYPILEHFAANTEEQALSNMGFMLWGNMNHNYNEATMGYLSGSDLSGGYYGSRGWAAPNLVTYMESHDEERLMFKNIQYGNASGSYNVKNLATGLQRNEMAAAIFFTQPGPRLVWQFGELGYDYSINTCSNGTTVDPNCRTAAKPIVWNYYQNADRRHLYDTYRALIALKKEPMFAAPTSYTQNLTGAVKTISVGDANLSVVTYGNFDVTAATASISFPRTGTWYNHLTGATLNVTSTSMSMTLQPGQYAVYTSRPVSLAARPAQPTALGLTLFPNPATNSATVSYELPTAAPATLTVQNLLGQTVREVGETRPAAGPQRQVISLQGLRAGVYLVKLQAGNQTQSVRLLVQ